MAVAGLGLAAAFAAPAGAQRLDLVIANGRVIDPESGLNAVRNVGIRGDRIVAVSRGPLIGRDTIDARGLIVSPGFIDLHRHAHGDNSYRYQVRDGVTTALELEVGTADVEAWYRQAGPGRLVNYGVAAGHIPARMRVLGDSGVFLPTGPGKGRATVPQAQEIVDLIETGLRQGAVSVGMGLAYTPEATSVEMLQIFRAAGRHRASVHVHLGGGMSSLVEIIGAAAVGGAPLHVVHVNSTGGSNVAYFLEAIDDARRHGMDVTTEAYPYTAGATMIQSALYDGWENWPDERFGSLQWAATGERLTRETFRKYRAQGGSVISHGNTEEALAVALASPLTIIASDGGRSERDAPTHPRAAGAFARVLGRYVRERGTLSLVEALRKMTIAPAKRLEGRVPSMKDRGRIRVGAFADIAVFDSATVIDKATYENAAIFSEGILFVLVNGTPVVRAGEIVPGRTPGRAIRAPIEQPK
ncbi:MAG: amidohydrolase family protein [Gemmatimonadales bacterium]|nr:amidohydrolase family protein [Gemmatimonadales bacterium]